MELLFVIGAVWFVGYLVYRSGKSEGSRKGYGVGISRGRGRGGGGRR